jgi:flavin-binding protein dodecin
MEKGRYGSLQRRGGALHNNNFFKGKEANMTDSVYKIIELVGTSSVSWEEAAKTAIEKASKSLRELRVAEISKLDMKVEDGKIVAYRARVTLSFKYGAD